MRNRCPPISAAVAVAGCIVLSGMAACTVGPDYTAPASSLAPFHNAAAVAAQNAARAAPPLDTWWTGFHDPVLTQIIQRALAQNLDLAASLARVQEARAAAEGAGARLLPTAELSSQATRVHQSLESPVGAIASHLPGFDRDVSLYDAGVGATWEVDLSGGLRRGLEAAKAEAEAAEAEHLGVRVSVAAEAADAYLQIRGDQARLKIAQDQVDTDASLLERVRLRYANGLAADREVAQAEGLMYQARATIPPLRQSLETQMNRLDVLMAAQPGTYAAELSTPAGIPPVPAVPTSLTPAEMLRRRPDVVAAERQVAAATARIGVAISDYYPKISLSGLLGFESMTAGDLFKATTFQPVGVAGLRWRLFDFGKVDAEVGEAKGATAAALAQYRKSVLEAAQDVENAFSSLVQLEIQAQELAREVAALQKARDASQQDYRTGIVELTDVLDADRQLLAAQDELARTRADTDRAAVAAFRAFGGGW